MMNDSLGRSLAFLHLAIEISYLIHSNEGTAMTSMTIGALARECGMSAKTIRYYESIGLLAEPVRTTTGYRLYDAEAVRRLELVRGARRLGLPLKQIDALLQRADAASCGDFRHHLLSLATRQILELDRQIDALAT